MIFFLFIEVYKVPRSFRSANASHSREIRVLFIVQYQRTGRQAFLPVGWNSPRPSLETPRRRMQLETPPRQERRGASELSC